MSDTRVPTDNNTKTTNEEFNDTMKRIAVVSAQVSLFNFTLASFGNGVYSAMRTMPVVFVKKDNYVNSNSINPSNETFSRLFIKNFSLFDRRFYFQMCVVIPLVSTTSALCLWKCIQRFNNNLFK